MVTVLVTAASLVLQRARALGTRLFHRFGIHCATHQIRIILISCVVITSLFYPALAIYSSSKPQSLSTSRILRFLAGNAVSGFYGQDDLDNLWVGHNSLLVREDAVSRARCGMERTLRVERILIQSGDDGVLNHRILLSTLHLEHQIEKVISSRGTMCLKQLDGRCFVLSPLAFWHYDELALRSDPNILDTLGLSRNVSVGGIPVTPHMVLAGRGSNEHVSPNFDYAMYLALTYFFPETDCLGHSDHAAWLHIVESAATQDAKLAVQVQEPTLIALEYEQKMSRNKAFSAISAFLYLAYITFFAYVALSMRRMNSVHSRIGLTFTALVEIAVSTITSLSVCALVGFKVTMVPWELLPIVIVFVGAENMFNLVDAVGKTSVTLPVKERIALGLGHAGTSNTLKVVFYNSILGVIAVFSVGAIRQFCAFAIVVLVAHWFLAHTFFMAVLSIDIQRLELEELLRQNASLAPSLSNAARNVPTPPSLPRWRKLIFVTQNMLRGRATKNISLFLLLAITATLYYTTYPSSTRNIDDTQFASPRALSRTNMTMTDHHSPTWHMWKFLNPKEDPLLHLRIETPTILTFRPDIANMNQLVDKAQRLRFARMFRQVFWISNIVVFPIAVTTGLLYGLLLYLLKNAELLEAQRNRAEGDVPVPEKTSRLENRISFTTLPRAFATDVELMAASEDGKVVAAVSLENEIIIWHVNNHTYICIDATDVLLRAASTSSTPSAITAITVAANGAFCAVGTGAGIIAVWSIKGDSIQSLPHLTLDNSTSGVTELQFINKPSGVSNPRSTSRSEPNSPSGYVGLVAVYDNGLVAKWNAHSLHHVTCMAPSRPGSIVKTMALRVHADEHHLVAHAMDDGTVELTELPDSESLLMPDCCLQAGNRTNLVSKVHVCRTEIGGRARVIIGVATDAGVVSIWDGVTGECISTFDEAFGEVNGLRISPISCEICHYCGELPLESFAISLSVGHVVLVYKAYVSVKTRRCTCTRNQPHKEASLDMLGRRSRSSSTGSPVCSAPLSKRGKLPLLFDPSPFPVSGHGVHSRRASEKDSLRRASEVLSLPATADDQEPSQLVVPPDTTSFASRGSIWQHVLIVRVGDTTCEKGTWNIINDNIIGVRRKVRTHGQLKGAPTLPSNAASSHGLTLATMERWELWTFDPMTLGLQSSPLISLVDKLHATHANLWTKTTTTLSVPRLPFTRISTFLVSGSSAFAGLGNTVGVFNFAPP